MDPYRSLILEQVEAVMEKDPKEDTLCELLKIASPKLKESDLDNVDFRSKLYRTLRLRVHPDKHSDTNRATKVFQNLDPFFKKCVKKKSTMQKQPSTRKIHSPQARSSFPSKFDVRDQWAFLPMHQKVCKTIQVPAQVAFQCMNARGAVAHDRRPELSFFVKDSMSYKTVEDVFNGHGGTRVVRNINDIKEELMTSGPVISTSFVLTKAFMKTTEKPSCFNRSLIEKVHPIMIVGWKPTSYGEVWRVQPLTRGRLEDTQSIAFGQYSIDNNCIVPANNLENMPWEHGPYFDRNLSKSVGWRRWNGLEATITSAELEKIGQLLGEDLLAASRNKTKFTLRDSTKIAHSKPCYLKVLKWENGPCPWCVNLEFF